MALVVKDGNGVNQNLPLYDPAFRVAAIGITPAATTTDILVLQGSATTIVRIKSIKLNGVATANGNMPALLIRRSAAASGGTATTPTPIKMDTSSADATAVLQVFSANPTVGTAVGNLGATRINFSTTATGAVVANQGWEFTTRGDQALTLRGTSQFLAVNLNGAAVPAGGLLDYEIEWEESNNTPAT